jgi:hypothetical protein
MGRIDEGRSVGSYTLFDLSRALINRVRFPFSISSKELK